MILCSSENVWNLKKGYNLKCDHIWMVYFWLHINALQLSMPFINIIQAWIPFLYSKKTHKLVVAILAKVLEFKHYIFKHSWL